MTAPPPVAYVLPFLGKELRFIETASAPNRRFRVELDGVPSRLRVRYDEGEWVESDDAPLDSVVTILAFAARTESPGRLALAYEYTDDLPNPTIDKRDITIEVEPTGAISFAIRYFYQPGSFY